MFDFDAGKLIIVGAVALVVIGPKELPRVLRQVGQTVAKLRRMASEFQSQFMDAMREAELADVKQEMSKIADSAKIDVAFDPIRDIRNQIGGAIAGETKPHEVSTTLSSLADLPSTNFDLSAIAPAADAPTDDRLVTSDSMPTLSDLPHGQDVQAATVDERGEQSAASHVAPPSEAIDQPPAPVHTLADVRDALNEKLGANAIVDRRTSEPVEEHTA